MLSFLQRQQPGSRISSAPLRAALRPGHPQRMVDDICDPLHKPIDPRTPVLFAIAEKNGFRGRYVALQEAISKAAEKRLNRVLPVNAPGAIGAIMCELGFPWQICRGIAVIDRCVGLVGHIAEEMRNPMALEIYERVDAEVREAALNSG